MRSVNHLIGELSHKGFETTMSQYSRDEIIEAARRAAAETDATMLSRSEFERLTGISQYHIYRKFPNGGWLEVVKLAGLDRHYRYNEPVPDDELIAEFHRVATTLGRIPPWPLFGSHAKVSADTVRKRFGGLQGTLKRYRAWLELNDADSPMLDILHARSQHEIPTPQTLSSNLPTPSIQWSRGEGVQYGPPLNFRGLRHAPINEQGVVYLFGMVSYELGYLVEAIHSAFPDCEAKRSVDRHNDRWQRVRIEFEYRSANFREHGHDVAACDLIVCWVHDWNDCPLEVLELRGVIGQLDG